MRANNSQQGHQGKVAYWWPGEIATNTRDYLLSKAERYNRGEKLVMAEVMRTLENTLIVDSWAPRGEAQCRTSEKLVCKAALQSQYVSG
jgi:hypothetical protein